MKEIKEKFDFNGSSIVVSTGRLAKKADFSVLIEWDETALLVTTGVGTKPIDRDFLPLSVEFQENLYAAGKIPGSFFRREGRPSQYSVLSARLIDRSIRTLFPKSYRNEVQVIVQPLAVDQSIDIRVPAMLATSIALNAGTSPFSSLVASVNIGYKDGEFVCNPSQKEEGKSDLDLFLTGTEEKINMIEVSANSLSEKDLYAAIEFGFAEIKRLIAFQKSFLKQTSRPKAAFEEKKNETEIAAVEERYRADIDKIIAEVDSNKRETLVADWKERLEAEETEEAKDRLSFAEAAVARCVRKQTLKNKRRIDGRAFDELRSLESDIDITGVVHGSALFARGDTQTLSTVTLGPLSDRQIVDDITIQDFRSFFHHYKSLPFAYGGVGRIFGVSRREVGHGALVEKALSWLLPDNENFPYTIRIVSEVLSSDGSTSQAAICSASLSLMATGVPIREPIAGIAIGLIRDDKGNHNLLTDIQAWEDFYGDMDFKIAGGRNGIYAIQLDMKIDGLPLPVIREVFERARVARMKLLDRMSETIGGPRKRLPKNVIKFQKIIIQTEAIARVIGPGGKNIKRVAAECDNVEIDVKDNGTVYLYHNDPDTLEKAKKMVLENAAAPASGSGGSNGFRKRDEKPPVVGSEHDGEIIGIKEYGLFVSLKGYEASGLMHLSRMPRKYAKKLDKNFSLNQRLRVRVSGIDEKNRISIEWVDRLD